MFAQIPGELRPIMFWGRVLINAERRYATLGRELSDCF